ncbi:MAG: hemolysin family protein [Lachnospiraceae bacterium]|nr:hemolysin family protein [Lachnospiraceae bacterium]MDD3615742.1 hemolysin family protein [Lachnospiraceae bacterium]
MDSSDVTQLVVLIILLCLSAFFSSAETAMTAVNKIRIQSMAEQGEKRASTLLKVLEDYSKMLSAVLIGNNIVNISASALATTLALHIWGNVAVSLATGVLTLLVLIFGEITPKTLASLHAEQISLSYANVIYALMTILTPVIFIVNKLAGFVLFLLHVDPNEKSTTITEHELRTYVDTSHEEGVIESEERQMINNVFDFGDSMAKDVMIPRIDMTFIQVDATYEELMEVFREDRFTRLPVYEDTTDTIIGIINMKDLLLYDRTNGFSLRHILRDAYFTYEHKRTSSLMLEMRKQSINLAIVLDEYGATAGLITLEDLLEEIVGEIRDEYDEQEEDDITEIVPGEEYRVLASTKLDDLNDALDLHLESEEYDSVGGYIIEQLDCLPLPGQYVRIEGQAELKVEKTDKKRIEIVHLTLLKPAAADDSEVEE